MTLLLLLRGGATPSVTVPDAGGADPDGAGIKSKKKPKRRIILNPEDLKAPKSVEEQVSEFLDARNKPAPKPKPRKKPAKSEPLILTDEEKEAMAYWAEQQAIDDEEDEIIMLLMAA